MDMTASVREKRKKYGKTRSMTVDKLDDGTYTSSMHDENGNSKKYSHKTCKDMAACMMEEMGEKKKDRMMGEGEGKE